MKIQDIDSNKLNEIIQRINPDEIMRDEGKRLLEQLHSNALDYYYKEQQDLYDLSGMFTPSTEEKFFDKLSEQDKLRLLGFISQVKERTITNLTNIIMAVLSESLDSETKKFLFDCIDRYKNIEGLLPIGLEFPTQNELTKVTKHSSAHCHTCGLSQVFKQGTYTICLQPIDKDTKEIIPQEYPFLEQCKCTCNICSEIKKGLV